MKLNDIIILFVLLLIPSKIFSLSVVSTDPAEGTRGVNPGSTVSMTFDKPLKNPSGYVNIADYFSLNQIKDKNGETIDPSAGLVVLDWNNIALSQTNTEILQITLPTNISKGSTFNLTVTTSVLDAAETETLADDFTLQFITIWNSLVENILFASDNIVKVRIPFETLPADGYVVIIEDPLNNTVVSTHDDIETANASAVDSSNLLKYPLTETMKEFNLYQGDSGNPFFWNNYKHTENLAGELPEITLAYSDADNDGIVDGTSPPVSEETLSMYRLDIDAKIWEKIGGTVDAAHKTITAQTNRLTVFVLMGSIYDDVNEAYAYPVPFKPNADPLHAQITFTRLTPGSTIKIFTVSGEKVRELHADYSGSDVLWDTRNDAGKKVVSGVYFYYISTSSSHKKGKLVIIR
ncbi:MAG: Ig-like domain-containing protein [bacterium]